MGFVNGHSVFGIRHVGSAREVSDSSSEWPMQSRSRAARLRHFVLRTEASIPMYQPALALDRGSDGTVRDGVEGQSRPCHLCSFIFVFFSRTKLQSCC